MKKPDDLPPVGSTWRVNVSSKGVQLEFFVSAVTWEKVGNSLANWQIYWQWNHVLSNLNDKCIRAFSYKNWQQHLQDRSITRMCNGLERAKERINGI